MRIAIYEPEPTMGGIATWGAQLRSGLRDLGHTANLVTFNRSGRPRTGGSRPYQRPASPDVTASYQEAVDVLKGYDGVILNDWLQPVQDRRAEDGNSILIPHLPDYLSILRQLTIPVTAAVHCDRYAQERLPFAPRLAALPCLTHSVVAHSMWAHRDAVPCITTKPAVETPLPYAWHAQLERAPRTGVPRVGIMGRYCAVKGHRVLAAAAAYDHLPGNTTVELWGAPDAHPGVPAPFITQNRLSDEGITVGTEALTAKEEQTRGRIATWKTFRKEGLTEVRYCGPYSDPLAVASRLDITVNLTALAPSSGGALEYAQLEGIDAGCMHIAVAHRWELIYEGIKIESVDSWPSDLQLARQRATFAPLQEIGTAVVNWLDAEKEWAEIAQHNRRTLRIRHEPAAVARAFVEVLTEGS